MCYNNRLILPAMTFNKILMLQFLLAFFTTLASWLLASSCFLFCVSSEHYLTLPQAALKLSVVSMALRLLILLLNCTVLLLLVLLVGSISSLVTPILLFPNLGSIVFGNCMFCGKQIRALSWLNSSPPGYLLIRCSYQKTSMLANLKII